MVVVSQCAVLMPVTKVQVFIGHFGTVFAPVTVNWESIIDVTDYAGMAVAKCFGV